MVWRVANPLNVLSICSGVGGLELGLRLAGLSTQVVGWVERDTYAATVLLARMEDETLEQAPVWCGDLESLDLRGLAPVDVITAGFPCQPFSKPGQQRRLDDERWIWPAIAGAIRTAGPGLVFLENVPALVPGGGLDPVLGDLADLGFAAEWGLFGASAVGSPHHRERLFILAHTPGTRWEGWRVRGHPELVRRGMDALYPPGPASPDWAEVDEGSEALPGLRRLADGSTSGLDPDRDAARPDELRSLGNAVVPQVAALALRVLAQRAGWMT